MALLAANGAPGMQAYLFARPMPLHGLLAFLARNTVGRQLREIRDEALALALALA